MPYNRIFKLHCILAVSILIIMITFGTVQSIYGQDSIPTPNRDMQVSILTCGPGTELYAMYGHNAIRVIDPDSGSDLVYNYGTFSFDEPGFMVKFLRGKLMYYITVAPYNHFIYEYEMTNRSVTEQILALNNKEKIALAAALDTNLLPENRYYKYDFFQDNCATRIRDMIFKKNILTLNSTSAAPLTYRQLIKKYQAAVPWTNFGIDLIIGAKADVVMTPSEECFIPDYLAYHVKGAKLKNNDQPLVAKENILFTSSTESGSTSTLANSFLSPYFLFLLLLLLEVNLYFRAKMGSVHAWVRIYDRIWVVIITMMMILLAFMWWGTDHIPTKTNWNLIWLAPFLIFWWLVRNKSGKNNWILGFGCLLLLLISLLNAIPRFNFLPQFFHPIVAIIMLILILKILRIKPLPWKS